MQIILAQTSRLRAFKVSSRMYCCYLDNVPQSSPAVLCWGPEPAQLIKRVMSMPRRGYSIFEIHLFWYSPFSFWPVGWLGKPRNFATSPDRLSINDPRRTKEDLLDAPVERLPSITIREDPRMKNYARGGLMGPVRQAIVPVIRCLVGPHMIRPLACPECIFDLEMNASVIIGYSQTFLAVSSAVNLVSRKDN